MSQGHRTFRYTSETFKERQSPLTRPDHSGLHRHVVEKYQLASLCEFILHAQLNTFLDIFHII